MHILSNDVFDMKLLPISMNNGTESLKVKLPQKIQRCGLSFISKGPFPFWAVCELGII